MPLKETIEKQGNYLFRYRSFLPLIILAVGIVVFVVNNMNGNIPTPQTYKTIQYIALGMSMVGLFIRIITVGHTPANTSGRNTKKQLADEVNSTGIYSMVRHPLYLGNFFMWAGAVLLIADTCFFIFFVLIYWIYYERIMFAEEQFLRAKFGQPYVDWAQKTPAFIPSCKMRIKSKYSFSSKKVLKKEKNGLLAVFLLLFIFHNIKYSFDSMQLKIENNWVLWSTVLSSFLYVLLKVLKNKTTLLDEKGR